MNVSRFIDVTTWMSILVIIFGVLTKLFDVGIALGFLGFLCIVGFLNYVLTIGGKHDRK